MQLFVCVVCTLLENHGKVARGLAMARGGREAGKIYEEQLKVWYSAPAFAAFRTSIVFLFVFSVPSFAVSLAFLCLLRFPSPSSYLCFLIFAVTGAGENGKVTIISGNEREGYYNKRQLKH
jgi:hypothetical protein